MNLLVEYYNAWVAKGIELTASAGWHTAPDGTAVFTQVSGMALKVLSPGGFWLTHIALIIAIVVIIYIPIQSRKLKHEQPSQ